MASSSTSAPQQAPHGPASALDSPTRGRIRRSKLTTLRSSAPSLKNQLPNFRTIPIPRKEPVKVTSLQFNPLNRSIAAGFMSGDVLIWDEPRASSNPAGREIETKAHKGSCTCVAWGPCGKLLASSGTDSVINVWSHELSKVQQMKEHSRTVWHITFSSSGHLLASCSGDCTARIWDVETSQCLHVLSGHSGSVQYVVFDPTDVRVATCSVDATAMLWDVKTGACLRTLTDHDEFISQIEFSPTERDTFATCSQDCTVRMWNKRECWVVLDDHNGDVTKMIYVDTDPNSATLKIHFTPRGDGLLSCSNDTSLLYYDLKLGQLKYKITGPKPMNDAVFSPDGSVIAGVDDGGNLSLWDSSTGEMFTTVCKHEASVSHVRFDRNGSMVCTADDIGTIMLWYLSPIDSSSSNTTGDKGRCAIS
eukprot:gene1385-4560_t